MTRKPEPVFHDGFAWGLDDGTLMCLRVADGKRMWKKGRYGYGQLLSVGDRLLVMDEEGTVHQVKRDTESHEELMSFAALDGGMTLNLPALAHGFLIVRNEKEVACFDLRPKVLSQDD